MIAVDTSSLIAFLDGEKNMPDVTAVGVALEDSKLVLPPVVLMEALSDPHAQKTIRHFLKELPTLEISIDYWERAADIRKNILKQRLKARLGDALVAQSCIDHNVPLITRDKDFRHYAEHCGLKLYHA